jgi:hypothetical protein
MALAKNFQKLAIVGDALRKKFEMGRAAIFYF